mgnify:FL=1
MKKLLLGALLVLTLSLTGCAEKKQSDTNTNQNNQQNQTTNDTNVQSGTTNDNNQEASVDIKIKDWLEAVTINGVKVTEFTETHVTDTFGDFENVKNENSITFTDINGKEYTGKVLHEETREDEIILRYEADNETEDFAVRFELEKNNAGENVLDGVRISQNGTSSMKDILLAWGIDKLDAKAYEMATNVNNKEDAKYQFACTTDYGRARVLVDNELNDEGYREIEVEVDFDDVNVPYTIELLEVYEGNNSENVKYFEIHIDR